ncbi:MAG: hypothetical protein U0638_13680 [Phycisphaerales bacterium]
MAQWKFRFDGSYTGNFYRVDTPLGVTFSRAVATVDPSGASVISNKPRFDRATHIAPVVAPTEVTIGSQGAAPESRLLAAGVAADGTTPLMVFRDEDHGKLFVLSGSTLSEVKRTDLTTVSLVNVEGNNPTEAACFTPSGLSSDYSLVPNSAVVVHGLVVLGGMLVKKVGSTETYEIVGWGFAQLTGTTPVWTHLWNDASVGDNQPNFYRGREWCLHASLAHARGDAHPLTCWVSSTDYRFQAFSDDDPPVPLTLGGRVFVLKFKRTTESDPWGWDTVSGNPFYADIEQGDGTFSTGCHAHSCQVTEYGSNSIQMVVSVGDAQYHSRFICYRLDSLGNDYSDPQHWSWTSAGYHGFRQYGPPDPLPGSRSQQPVGVALGPRPRLAQPFSNSVPISLYRSTLIWGTDEQAEVLTRMVLPEPTEVQNGTDQLWIEHLHGFTTGFGSVYDASFSRLRGIVFCLAQSIAESGAGSLVAVLSNASDDDGGDPPQRLAITRLLYCPDQSHPDRWMQVFSTWGRSEGTAVLYDARVFFNSYSQLDTHGGLQYISVPTDTTVFKPIIVAPGGKNLAIEDCWFDIGDQAPSSDDGIVALTKNTAGKWVDTLPNSSSRTLPSPPSLTTEVFRIRTRRAVPGTTNKFICRVHLSADDANNWNELASGQGWSTGTKVRRIRCWVLDGTWGVLTGANSQSSPNKTAQMSVRTRTGLDTNVDPAIVQGAPLLYSCSNRWCPITIIGVRTITNDPPNHLTEGIAIELLCASDTNSPIFPPDDNYFYLAIDGAFDGNGSLPYPVALSEVGSTPSTNPDELLTVTIGTTGGVSPLGLAHDWTLRLAGQVPIGNWDQYAERRDSNGLDARYWPLFTLWADASNWIEFSANCTNMGFRVRVQANGGSISESDLGSSEQLWLPESTLFAAISWDSNTGTLYFGGSLAAGAVATGPSGGLSISWGSGVSAFTQLRFRGAPDMNDEVCEFRWFGGDVSDSASDNDVLTESAFNSIAFAKGPTT